MSRFRTLWRLAAILAVAAGLPCAARADFMLSLTDVGANQTVYGSQFGGDYLYSGQVGSFSVAAAYGTSNAPGGINAIDQVGSFYITNTSKYTQTLTIEVSATGFNSPQSPPPLNIYDTVSGSVATGSVISGTFQGFADTNDSATPGVGTPGQLLSIQPTGASNSFDASGAVSGVFNPNGKTYSVSIIETLTVAAGTQLTITGGNVTVAMPAPTNMLLAIAGISVVGVWSQFRRKKAVAIAR